MFRKFKSLISVCLILCLMVSLTMFAPAVEQNITISYTGIKIYIGEKYIIPMDANGALVDPFVSEGTTYVPVRAVSEAMNKSVIWNDEQKTVFIGGISDKGPTYGEAPSGKAETVTKTIAADFDGIKVYVDGALINPTDANGNAVSPFIYEGTTYLPLRAIVSALGRDIEWDGSTNSIYISGGKSEEASGGDSSTVQPSGETVALEALTHTKTYPDNRWIKAYDFTKYFDCDGFEVKSGIVIYNSNEVKFIDVTYDIGGEYVKFTGKASQPYDDVDINAGDSEAVKEAKNDSASYEYVIELYGDGELIGTSKSFYRRTYPREFEFDVTGVSEMTIRIKGVSGSYIEGINASTMIPAVIIENALLHRAAAD